MKFNADEKREGELVAHSLSEKAYQFYRDSDWIFFAVKNDKIYVSYSGGEGWEETTVEQANTDLTRLYDDFFEEV